MSKKKDETDLLWLDSALVINFRSVITNKSCCNMLFFVQVVCGINFSELLSNIKKQNVMRFWRSKDDFPNFYVFKKKIFLKI